MPHLFIGKYLKYIFSSVIWSLVAVITSNTVNAQVATNLLSQIEHNVTLTPEQTKLLVEKTIECNNGEKYHIVKDSLKNLMGVVKVSNGKLNACIDIKFPYIDEIQNLTTNDDAIYVYLFKSQKQHYVYNLPKGELQKLHFEGDKLNYHVMNTKYFVGETICGELFDLCDIYCGPQISPFQIPVNMKLQIQKDKTILESGLCSIRQEFDISNPPKLGACRYVTHEVKAPSQMIPSRMIEYWIDFPQSNDLYARKIKYWISEQIQRNLFIPEIFVCGSDDTPISMQDYYTNRFFISDSINIREFNKYDGYSGFSFYSFQFLKQWESNAYVTYVFSVFDDRPVINWYDPFTVFVTFSKETGEMITENDLFVEGNEQEISTLIEKLMKEKGVRSSEWKDSYDFSLTPQGVLADIRFPEEERLFMIIPYDIIRPYLSITPMEENGKDVSMESAIRASRHARTIYQEEFQKNYIPSEAQVKLLESRLDEYSGEYLLALTQLADVYDQTENTKRAMELRQDYLNIIERQIGYKNKAWEAQARPLLKDLLADKHYEQAGKICDKFSEIWVEKDLQYETTIEDEQAIECEQKLLAAETYFQIGNLQKSVKTCRQAIQIANDMELLARGLSQMSRYHYSLNNVDSCLQYIYNSIYMVPQIMTECTALKRMDVWEHFQGWFCEFIPLVAYQIRSQELMTMSYNALLFGKGLLLNTESSLREVMFNSGDTLLYNKYETIQNLKRTLAQLRVTAMNYDNKKELTEEILTNIKSIEKELILNSAQYGDFSKKLLIDVSMLKNVLANHELAIEFALIDDYYYALLIRKDIEGVKMVKLCSEEQLMTESATTCHTLIWEPIMDYLQDVTDIYFSPSGSLYHKGIEYAFIPNIGIECMNERYHIYRLSSTRQLVITRNHEFWSSQSPRTAVLYGGIDYDNLDTHSDFDKHQLTYRSVYDLQTNGRGCVNGLPYLPGTNEEVETISEILYDAPSQVKVQVFMKSAATESSLKQLSGKDNGILHIATHGFYLTKEDADQLTDDPIIHNISNMTDKYVDDRELMRSGLVMAGAMAEKDNKNDEDGILTALEIACLNLTKTNLVVLSACDTALGDVSSEGVFGLQRGFKKAGAQTLLMSLWKVDDTATRLFMTEFYRKLSQGCKKQESLVHAQKYLRQCQGGAYAKPEYWAAFILLDGLE